MLITFSGTDGAGKSTQLEQLRSDFRARGLTVSQVWIRGGYTPLFLAAKAIVRKIRPGAIPGPGNRQARAKQFASPKVRRLWLAVAIVDLGLFCLLWVRCLIWSGRVVLCDRYLEDTLLDFRRNFPQEKVDDWLLWRLVAGFSPRPDHSFLLLVTPEESARRSLQKSEPFPDSLETVAWRYGCYRELATSGRWKVIDGAQPVDAVRREIDAILFR